MRLCELVVYRCCVVCDGLLSSVSDCMLLWQMDSLCFIRLVRNVFDLVLRISMCCVLMIVLIVVLILVVFSCVCVFLMLVVVWLNIVLIYVVLCMLDFCFCVECSCLIGLSVVLKFCMSVVCIVGQLLKLSVFVKWFVVVIDVFMVCVSLLICIVVV